MRSIEYDGYATLYPSYDNIRDDAPVCNPIALAKRSNNNRLTRREYICRMGKGRRPYPSHHRCYEILGMGKSQTRMHDDAAVGADRIRDAPADQAIALAKRSYSGRLTRRDLCRMGKGRRPYPSHRCYCEILGMGKSQTRKRDDTAVGADRIRDDAPVMLPNRGCDPLLQLNLTLHRLKELRIALG